MACALHFLIHKTVHGIHHTVVLPVSFYGSFSFHQMILFSV